MVRGFDPDGSPYSLVAGFVHYDAESLHFHLEMPMPMIEPPDESFSTLTGVLAIIGLILWLWLNRKKPL